MRLGQLIESLEPFNADADLRLDSGGPPGTFCSYRGIYEHLALTYGDEPVAIGAFLRRCRNADGHTFTGWKGGEYQMGALTPVWLADEGCSPGLAIVGVADRGDGKTVELITADIEEYR